MPRRRERRVEHAVGGDVARDQAEADPREQQQHGERERGEQADRAGGAAVAARAAGPRAPGRRSAAARARRTAGSTYVGATAVAAAAAAAAAARCAGRRGRRSSREPWCRRAAGAPAGRTTASRRSEASVVAVLGAGATTAVSASGRGRCCRPRHPARRSCRHGLRVAVTRLGGYGRHGGSSREASACDAVARGLGLGEAAVGAADHVVRRRSALRRARRTGPPASKPGDHSSGRTPHAGHVPALREYPAPRAPSRGGVPPCVAARALSAVGRDRRAGTVSP